MGVWGTAIFSDDLASDICGAYRDALGEGLSGPEATQRVLRDYSSSIADSDESSVVWLALAAVQWKLGRLEDEVRDRALQVIESGADLARWDAGSPDHSRRRAVLEKLREKIGSPQPATKRIARRVLCECPWCVGDVIAYRLLSENLVLFKVDGTHTDNGGTYPECVLLDWAGTEIPPAPDIKRMPIKPSRSDYKHKIHHLMLVGLSPKWSKRIQDLNLSIAPLSSRIMNRFAGKAFSRERKPTSVIHFKYLDGFLKEYYLLE